VNDIPPKDSWTTFEKELRVMEWRDCVVTFKYEKAEGAYEEDGWRYEITDLTGTHLDDGNRIGKDTWKSSLRGAVYRIGKICECRHRYGGKPPTLTLPLPDGFPQVFTDYENVRVKPVCILHLLPEHNKSWDSVPSLDTRLVVEYDDGRRMVTKIEKYRSMGSVIPLVEDHESLLEIEHLEQEAAKLEREMAARVKLQFTDIVEKHVSTYMADLGSTEPIIYMSLPDGVNDICDELGRSKIEGVVVVVNVKGEVPYNIYLRTVMTDKAHAYKNIIPLNKVFPIDDKFDPGAGQRLRQEADRLHLDMLLKVAEETYVKIEEMLRELRLTTG
jgi:hypothetical protein